MGAAPDGASRTLSTQPTQRRSGNFLRDYGITPELAGTPGRRGFQVEPRRWKAEQTFGCLQRYRRLRVDDETSLVSVWSPSPC
jgi:hypothetical protein